MYDNDLTYTRRPNRKHEMTKAKRKGVRQFRRRQRNKGIRKRQGRQESKKRRRSVRQSGRRPLERTSGYPPKRPVPVKTPDLSQEQSCHDADFEEAESEDSDVKGGGCQRKLPESKLMSRYEERLRGSRFRTLNQKFYVSTGRESLQLFKKEADLFEVYHQGYLQSMQHWSIQPVDVAIKWLKKQQQNWKVVDYGCGEAKIMKAGLKQEVTSLDLVAMHDGVIVCDMTASPLDNASKEIAIFSLSLMGTDYHRCLLDAARVLKINGILWIAEVCSRFADHRGKEDYHAFFEAIKKLGFERVLSKKPSHLFVVLIFKKLKNVHPKTSIKWPVLKPCLYKRR